MPGKSVYGQVKMPMDSPQELTALSYESRVKAVTETLGS